MGLKESSLWIKISAVILVVANILNLIAFTTTSWARHYHPGGGHTAYGLWQICFPGECQNTISYVDIQDWLRAAQCFLTVGFLLLAGAGAAVLAYLFLPGFDEMSIFPLAGGGAALASVLFQFIGIMVYGIEKKKELGDDGNLHYSFGLSVVAMILAIPGGITAFLDLIGQ